MSVFLALTPQELKICRGLHVPNVHIAYAIGSGGRLLRSELPRELRGGLMGLSDRCRGTLDDPVIPIRAILSECVQRRFSGVLADFEGTPPQEDRLSFLTRLGAALEKSGKRLFVPESHAVPHAQILICTAISGGTLRERLSDAIAQYGAQRLALDCQRLAMDFTLPCRSGEGKSLTREEVSALREEEGALSFFSDELGANYFSFQREEQAHFVLFDTVETLRYKLRLGRERGIETAFFMYPEVDDLLPALLVP